MRILLYLTYYTISSTFLILQAEVDKVLFELTSGKLGEAPDALKDTLAPQIPSKEKEEREEEEEDDLEEMQNRLQALRS